MVTMPGTVTGGAVPAEVVVGGAEAAGGITSSLSDAMLKIQSETHTSLEFTV